jgi:hypothetical protein
MTETKSRTWRIVSAIGWIMLVVGILWVLSIWGSMAIGQSTSVTFDDLFKDGGFTIGFFLAVLGVIVLLSSRFLPKLFKNSL